MFPFIVGRRRKDIDIQLISFKSYMNKVSTRDLSRSWRRFVYIGLLFLSFCVCFSHFSIYLNKNIYHLLYLLLYVYIYLYICKLCIYIASLTGGSILLTVILIRKIFRKTVETLRKEKGIFIYVCTCASFMCVCK